jgi:hypothetical protein
MYEITLADGPIGLMLTSNRNGPDLSAVVEDVPAGSQCDGYIKPGDVLVSVNGKSTAAMHYQETLSLIQREARPITLSFCLPPPGDTPTHTDEANAVFTAYIEEDADPTGAIPQKVAMLAGRTGLQYCLPGVPEADPLSATVCYMPWSSMTRMEPAKQSDDPDDMELLTLEFSGIGTFVFECNDAFATSAAFERERARA